MNGLEMIMRDKQLAKENERKAKEQDDKEQVELDYSKMVNVSIHEDEYRKLKDIPIANNWDLIE